MENDNRQYDMAAKKIKIEVPPWVGFTAIDANGRVWGYENEPFKNGDEWDDHSDGRVIWLALEQPTSNWQNSLRRI